MTRHHDGAKGAGTQRKANRRTLLTDPVGLALLLGSTAVMMAVALIKAQGLPFQRPRHGAPRR